MAKIEAGRAKASRAGRSAAEAEKADAAGQFVRRRKGSNPTRNPDGVHSASPLVISGDGDATQPVAKTRKSVR